MSKDAIIDALAHLVGLLIAERNAPPEEGGWIRTQNTAYRPSKASVVPEDPQSEKHAQIGSIGAKNTEDGRGRNHPGTNHCSRCGRAGRNVRTCAASFRDSPPPEKHGGVGCWVRVQRPDGQGWQWTNQGHRRDGE